MKYITIILLFFASVLQGQTGAGFWHGSTEPGTITPEVDTLTLTYWDDFILLHIANTGITEDVNGVSQWQDRSGNGNHSTQSVNLNKPSTDVDGNVVFDGVNDYLDVSDLFTTTTDSAYTIFFVVEFLNASTTQQRFFSYQDGNGQPGVYSEGIYIAQRVDSISNTTVLVKSFIKTVASPIEINYDTIDINATYLLTTASSENTNIFLTKVNSTFKNSDSTSKTHAAVSNEFFGARIGSNRNATGNYSNIKIKFIGITHRKMTTTEIATTESELNSFFIIY